MAEKNEKKYVSDNARLMAEWNWEKNEGVSPAEVTLGSNKIIWWSGKCGHCWEAPAKERNRGYGCPICSGKRVIEGINDFKSNYPQLATQWDYAKNHPLLPNMITHSSAKQVWWICDLGHSYKSSVYNRVRGRGCPYCSSKLVSVGTSDLESKNPYLASEYSSKNPLKADSIFAHSHKKVLWECKLCGHEWEATVGSRMRGNGCPECSKRAQTSFPEQAVYYYIKQLFADAINRYTASDFKMMELDIYIPSLKIGIEYDGAHWHNNNISAKREARKFDLCKKQGIFLIRIVEQSNQREPTADVTIVADKNINITINMLRNYVSIPEDINVERDKLYIISSYIQSTKENSFATKHPQIAKEWNYEKNHGLTPDMFSEYSTYAKFWWRCSNGHEWQSTIAHRVGMNSNCPYCSNRKTLKGYNDFLTTNKTSHLMTEWDYIRNEKEDIYPDEITEGSNKKVWWKCQKGHSWKTSISQRKRGDGCPICAGQAVLSGYNDLQTTHPKLVCDWNYEKNLPLVPSMVSFGSDKKVWWKCTQGHEWQAMIRSRSRGNGCPYCSGRKIVTGETDLSTTHPQLANEWHDDKNFPLVPSMVSFGSNKKVWWKCAQGHEWQALIADRSKGSGCPICAGKTILKGYNDFASKRPDLLGEWDYEKNTISPDSIAYGSNKKIWWKCDKGHSYSTSINNKRAGAKCPFCSGKKVLKGFNDLATTHPILIEEWNHQKNVPKPTSVSAGSQKKVWWTCKMCEFEWQAPIYNRTAGHGCPKCAREKRKKVKQMP